MREECPHDLTDLVGRDHARDPEPVGELGRDRRLADAGDAAEQDDQRPVEAARAATTGGSGWSPPRPPPRAAPPRRARAARRRSPPARRAAPSRSSISARERERALGRQPGRHDRLRHQPLRVRKAVVAADHDDLVRAPARSAFIGSRAASASRSRSAASERAARVEVGLAREARPAGCARTRSRRATALGLLGDDLDRGRLELGQVDVAALARGQLEVAARAALAPREVGREQTQTSTPCRASALAQLGLVLALGGA